MKMKYVPPVLRIIELPMQLLLSGSDSQDVPPSPEIIDDNYDSSSMPQL